MACIEITKEQAESVVDFLEAEFINGIRNDPDLDNLRYVVNICEVYKKLNDVARREVRSNA